MQLETSRRIRGRSETAVVSEAAKAAWSKRNRDNDLEAAIALIKSDGDLNEEGDNLTLLKMLFESERNADFQKSIIEAIGKLIDSDLDPSPEYLTYLLHFSERACLDPKTIDSLLEIAKRRCRESYEIKAAYSATLHRQKYRYSSAPEIRDRVTIISIGLHCLPWALLNRWGWRHTADFHTCFNPFSLAVHRADGVVNALVSNFSDYFKTDELLTVKSANGHVVVARKDRGAVWNHNKGEYWLKDDYLLLRANMDWKIGNFRENCRRANPVFLLGNCLIDYPNEPLEFLEPLKKALASFTGREDNHIIVTNQKMPPEGKYLHKVDDTTFFFFWPYPDKSYVWHDDDTADGRSGLIYERKYLSYLRYCLNRWDLVERPSNS
jgi:hypothetical protein